MKNRTHRATRVLILSLACGLAMAQVPVSRTQMAGNLPGFSGFNYDGSIEASYFVSPTVDNTGKTVYLVSYGYYTRYTYGGHYYSAFASGIAPASAVSQSTEDALSVEIDLPQLQNVSFQENGTDANGNWFSNTTPPATFPLRGTVTAYRGPAGGVRKQFLGAAQVNQFLPPYTYSIQTSGNFMQASAVYVGSVGTYTMQGFYGSPRTNIFINKGNTVVEVTKTK